jgi:high-affinity iron transporter
MIPSFLLSLREGIEAALIIGIVLGALRKIGRSDLSRTLWAGVSSAVFLSILSALLLRALDAELKGRTEQIFEGFTMFLAAGVLTWMIYWMQRQSRGLKAELESNVQQATSRGGQGALFLMAFIAVLREGIELALFLTATSLASSGIQTLLGSLLGLMTACLLGYLLFASTIRLNLQRFFQVTSVLLILFAAGLIAHSMHEFNEAGIIPAIIDPIWNLNPILDDQSLVGVTLSTLFGYHGNPSLTEVLAYIGYILVTFIVFKRARSQSS